MNLEAARAEIVDEMSQPISHRSGGDIDGAVNVLLAEYDRRGEELAGYDAQAQKWVHNELARLRRQRDAVLALHDATDVGQCSTCSNGDAGSAAEVPWPCPTVRALGGGS